MTSREILTMQKNERIKKDKRDLKRQGYKHVRLLEYYNYYDDNENALTKYIAQKGKQKEHKYFIPTKLNPDVLWESIKLTIDKEIIEYNYDYTDKGFIANVLLEGNTKRSAMLIKITPDLDMEVKHVK